VSSGESESGNAKLQERLRALRVDPPDGGFALALHRRLVAAGTPKEQGLWQRLRAAAASRPHLLWPAAGLAAALAAFVALGLIRAPAPLAPALIGRPATTEVPSTKVAMIRLDLTADVAVPDAAIEVRLPEGLVFWSDGKELAQRTFEWTQPLAAGGNEIPIAVRGLRPGHYQVVVKARIGDEGLEDTIPLEVVDG